MSLQDSTVNGTGKPGESDSEVTVPIDDVSVRESIRASRRRRSSPLAARDESSELIEEYLPLVNHIVFQVAAQFPRHVEREELARAGALGLVEAARRYDESRGVPFNRYAAQRIRGAIIDSVRSADWAPRSIRALARQLDQAEQRLAGRLGRIPSIGETAAELGMSREELDGLRDRLFRSVVLAFDSMGTESDDEELTVIDILADGDTVEPATELEARELRSYMSDAVGLLPERHRLVIIGYFMENRTSAELARFLGVTESRISQMRSEALDMLRAGIEAQYRDHEDVEPGSGSGSARPGLVERRRARYAADISSARSVDERISTDSEDPQVIMGSVAMEEVSLGVVSML